MKKLIVIILCTALYPSYAQQRAIERIFISTDRASYVAGERIWLSLYCFDMSQNERRFTEVSSVAYVELRNGASMVSNAKLRIDRGRGSGYVTIPLSLPTGNYRLVAYTKQMLNEGALVGFDKVVPIYNTLSAERLPEGVFIEEATDPATGLHGVDPAASGARGVELTASGVHGVDPATASGVHGVDPTASGVHGVDPTTVSARGVAAAAAGGARGVEPADSKHLEVRLGVGQDVVSTNRLLPLSLKNVGNEAVTLSLSIARADLPTTSEEYFLHDFFAQNRPDPTTIKFPNHHIPEYEGEVIRGKILNIAQIIPKGISIFLSATGKEVNVYEGPVDTRTGEFTFFTNSLYGNREIVLEYPTPEWAVVHDVSFVLFEPFVTPPVQPVPPLFLDPKYELPLTERSMEMQVNHRFGIDTLFEKRPILDDPLININKPVIYPLDNYTRFPTMQDIVTEFITELRFRRASGKPYLQVFLIDWGWILINNPLVVLDGIALFDHEKIYQYDPLKVKSITIHRNRYRMGSTAFDGIVKFDTYGGDYPGLVLKKNALIMDYQGVQYPSRFTGHLIANSDHFPDLRTLLYWDPQVDIAQGAHQEVQLRTSSMPGKYTVVLQGVTASGHPIYHKSEFTVE